MSRWKSCIHYIPVNKPRYKSHTLLTEEALISAMAHVDLNPIRAAMAETPETSDHTSTKERIKSSVNLSEAIRQAFKEQALFEFTVPLKPPLSLDGIVAQEAQTGILFRLKDYLTLVDWTERAIRDDKRGYIPNQPPAILERFSIEPDIWFKNSSEF